MAYKFTRWLQLCFIVPEKLHPSAAFSLSLSPLMIFHKFTPLLKLRERERELNIIFFTLSCAFLSLAREIIFCDLHIFIYYTPSCVSLSN
jgi:hypothetical protein